MQTTSPCVGLTLAELSAWLSADAGDVGVPVVGARLMTSSGARLVASLGEARLPPSGRSGEHGRAG